MADAKSAGAGEHVGGRREKQGKAAASCFSRFFFQWVGPLVSRATQGKGLSAEDLYSAPLDHRAAALLTRFDEEWARQLASGRPSLALAFWRLFRSKWIWTGLMWILMETLAVATPLVIQQLLIWYSKSDSPPMEGYIWVCVLFIVQFVYNVIVINHLVLALYVIGMDLRTICNAIVHRKSLSLSPSARAGMSAGKIVNLMSTDAEGFPRNTVFLHALWAAPLFVGVAVALLVRLIGVSALVGVGIVVLSIPLQGFLALRQMKLQKELVGQTDARVHLVNEVLQSIKVIKFYTWEASFKSRIDGLRALEVRKIVSFAYLSAYGMVLMLGVPTLMILLTFYTFYETDGDFRPQVVFTAVALLAYIRTPLRRLPEAVGAFVKAKISLARLQKFLLQPDFDWANVAWSDREGLPSGTAPALSVQGTFQHPVGTSGAEEIKFKKSGDEKDGLSGTRLGSQTDLKRGSTASVGAVTASSASATGVEDIELTQLVAKKSNGENKKSAGRMDPFLLRDVRLDDSAGRLVAVVGPVGSGKSSLLAAILGEMPSVNNVEKDDKNGGGGGIGVDMDGTRCNAAVRMRGRVAFCAQQAWIFNATLRNNILFGRNFDEKRYKAVTEACALVTDLDALPAGDQTEIGEKGINLSGGQKQRVALARAVYADADIYLLDDILSAVDARVSRHLFDRVVCGLLRGKKVIFATNQLHLAARCDWVVALDRGTVSEQGTFQELSRGSGAFSALLRAGSSREGRSDIKGGPDSADASADTSNGSRNIKTENKKSGSGSGAAEAAAAGKLVVTESRQHGAISAEVLKYFFVEAMGGMAVPAILVVLVMSAQSCNAVFDWWLSVWSESFQNNGREGNNDYYLTIYAVLGVATLVIALVRSLAVARALATAAEYLHVQLLASILRAPMSFFDQNPSGRVLNRFAKDMDQVDTQLQRTVPGFLLTAAAVCVMLLSIAVLAPVFFVALIPIVASYHAVQKAFRPVSRQLQRIESISRSPIFSGFSEAISGATTVRAFGAGRSLARRNQLQLDASNRAFYLLQVTNRWLTVRLGLIGALTMGAVGVIVVVGRQRLTSFIAMNGGLAGFLLLYAMQSTLMFNWALRMYVESEAKITSAERIREFAMVTPERGAAPGDAARAPTPPADWPSRGGIDIKNLILRYRPGLPAVLKGIHLAIPGGSKIGIVGRTGSGKSSLVLALLRVVEPDDGSEIRVDGVDINALSLSRARQVFTCIPQDPVMFEGSLRYNLDPFDNHSDQRIWAALDTAGLADIVRRDMRGGLESRIAAGGANLSVGQRQLVCLARAVLREPKILIMDEATASIDMETDAAVQRTVRSAFVGCTVITIAHRLDTIAHSDHIIVMDAGRVAEFGPPAALLRKSDSAFGALVEQLGTVGAEALRREVFGFERARAGGGRLSSHHDSIDDL